MEKKYTITEEEFAAMQEAISKVLKLWAYNIIETHDDRGSISMSKKTFFDSLREEFVIEKE